MKKTTFSLLVVFLFFTVTTLRAQVDGAILLGEYNFAADNSFAAINVADGLNFGELHVCDEDGDAGLRVARNDASTALKLEGWTMFSLPGDAGKSKFIGIEISAKRKTTFFIDAYEIKFVGGNLSTTKPQFSFSLYSEMYNAKGVQIPVQGAKITSPLPAAKLVKTAVNKKMKTGPYSDVYLRSGVACENTNKSDGFPWNNYSEIEYIKVWGRVVKQ